MMRRVAHGRSGFSAKRRVTHLRFIAEPSGKSSKLPDGIPEARRCGKRTALVIVLRFRRDGNSLEKWPMKECAKDISGHESNPTCGRSVHKTQSGTQAVN